MNYYYEDKTYHSSVVVDDIAVVDDDVVINVKRVTETTISAAVATTEDEEAVPLYVALRHSSCWGDTEFPSNSSVKKCIRNERSFFVRTRRRNNNNNTTITICSKEDEIKELGEFQVLGQCNTMIRSGDIIRRRRRLLRTDDHRSSYHLLQVAYMDEYIAVIVKPHGMSVPNNKNKSINNKINKMTKVKYKDNEEEENHEDDDTNHDSSRMISLYELLYHCLPPSYKTSTLMKTTPIITKRKIDVREDEQPQQQRDDEFLRRPIPVHRLDLPTFGLVLVARDMKQTERYLKQQFANNTNNNNHDHADEDRSTTATNLLRKRYHAIVYGHVNVNNNSSNNNIIRIPLQGKECISEYRIVERCIIETTQQEDTDTTTIKTKIPITIVDLYPRTGRKHQLRKHMLAIGYPIIGDIRYSTYQTRNFNAILYNEQIMKNNRKTNMNDGDDKKACNEQQQSAQQLSLMLAAIELTFQHPNFDSIIPSSTKTTNNTVSKINDDDHHHCSSYEYVNDSKIKLDPINKTVNVQIDISEPMKQLLSLSSSNIS